jgi:NitT/TauT family transport system permease protein
VLKSAAPAEDIGALTAPDGIVKLEPAPQPRVRAAVYRVQVVASRLVLTLSFLALWQAAADLNWVDPFFTSRPTAIAEQLVKWIADGSIFPHIAITLWEAGLGFSLGMLAGIPLGFLLARFRFLDDVTQPFLDVLNATPRMALVSLFVLWLGLGVASKVALTFSVVVLVFIINSYAGVKAVEDDYVRVARLLGASRWQLEWKIVLPAALPVIFAGVRLGVAYALSATIVAEIVAANRGLGFLIAQHTGVLDTTGALTATVVIMLLAWLINAVPNFVERKFSKWKE